MHARAIGRRLGGQRAIDQGESLHHAEVVPLARREAMCHLQELRIVPLHPGNGVEGKGLGSLLVDLAHDGFARLSRDARQQLMAYHWPGNVRELRNILERAAILCDGGLITGEHLNLMTDVSPAASAPVPASASGAVSPESRELPAVERSLVEQALRDARFNKSKAAKTLGLTRAQLYVRMKKYGLD